MNSNQKGNQFGQGSNIDGRQTSDRNDATENNINIASQNPQPNDDDFLSGDNKSKTYPNNQNNPNEGYNKQLSPGQRNANIGGNESEYETSAEEEDRYNYGASEHDEVIEIGSEDFASEEQEKSNNETRYNSPTRNGSHRNHDM